MRWERSSAGKDWASPVSKGLVLRQRLGCAGQPRLAPTPANHKINLYLNGAVAATIMAPAGGWQVGRWYHYAFTRSGATIKGYLDGVEKAQRFTTQRCRRPIHQPSLLGKNATPSYPWQGGLDDLRIYRRALPAAEVQTLYRSGWQATTLTQHGADGAGAAVAEPACPPGWKDRSRSTCAHSDTAGHTEVVREREAHMVGQHRQPGAACHALPHRLRRRLPLHHRGHRLQPGHRWLLVALRQHGRATYFQSPWYVALASSSPKLYQLTADCTLPAGSVDRAGHSP